MLFPNEAFSILSVSNYWCLYYIGELSLILSLCKKKTQKKTLLSLSSRFCFVHIRLLKTLFLLTSGTCFNLDCRNYCLSTIINFWLVFISYSLSNKHYGIFLFTISFPLFEEGKRNLVKCDIIALEEKRYETSISVLSIVLRSVIFIPIAIHTTELNCCFHKVTQ